ncbi:MAG: phosphate ABC transporter permease PstA, partial [Gammaproteobacteria bacterium]
MKNKQTSIGKWFATGDPYIWLTAGTVSLSVLMVTGLILLIMVRGLGHFWPAPIAAFDYTEQGGKAVSVAGQLVDEETVPRARMMSEDTRIPAEMTLIRRQLIKIGNRDFFGLDYRWVLSTAMRNITYPETLMAVERREWGNFYGYLQAIKEGDQVVSATPDWAVFQQYIADSAAVFKQIRYIERDL